MILITTTKPDRNKRTTSISAQVNNNHRQKHVTYNQYKANVTKHMHKDVEPQEIPDKN